MSDRIFLTTVHVCYSEMDVRVKKVLGLCNADSIFFPSAVKLFSEAQYVSSRSYFKPFFHDVC